MGTGNSVPSSFGYPWLGTPYMSCLGCGSLVEERFVHIHFANCAPSRAIEARNTQPTAPNK